jgi:protein required for attachment to host cells
MEMSWIVVSDAGRARIFATLTQNVQKDVEHIHEWSLIETFDHHDIHKKSANNVLGENGSHHFGTSVDGSDPKKMEAANFAQGIAFYLEKSRAEHKYTEIIMIAPPHFMGILNQHMSKEVSKLIRVSIDKDYTTENEKTLVHRVQEHLK